MSRGCWLFSSFYDKEGCIYQRVSLVFEDFEEQYLESISKLVKKV